MLPTNEIKPRVQAIADQIIKDSGKQSPEDLAAAKAVVELVTSCLEAFHDIAFYLGEQNDRAVRRGE